MKEIVTGFENITSKVPINRTIDECLQRIKSGASKGKVEKIRNTKDKEEKQKIKKTLPSICFSGEFGPNRKDEELINHSGYIVLDFDDILDTETLKHDLIARDYVAASWVSPSGTGVKALVKIADPSKHREHFQALNDIFKNADKSGINVARVCYESYDPDIFIKEKCVPFKTIKTTERVREEIPVTDGKKTFDKLKQWLDDRGDAYVTGNRNLYIFKLTSACCRFGMPDHECEMYVHNDILVNDTTFTSQEAVQTIKSAYRSNHSKFGTATFVEGNLVDKVSKRNVEIDVTVFDLSVKPKDVIYGSDVKADAFRLYDFGFESATTTNIPELDVYWKWKRGEITLLSGIGNYGKSTFLKFIMLMKSIKEDWKWALFAPEDFPAHEFYHDLTEMMIGTSMTPNNPMRPSKVKYEVV